MEKRMQHWSEVIDHIRAAFKPDGFDVVVPFQIAQYHRHLADPGAERRDGPLDPRYRLDNLGSDQHLGVLIGNTRELWTPFIRWLAEDSIRLQLDHPLDTYSRFVLRKHLENIKIDNSVRYADDVTVAPFAAQKLAQWVGYAWQSPASLSIHPVMGPWIAFRAVVSFSIAGPEPLQPPAVDPCGACARACLPALDRALAVAANGGGDGESTPALVTQKEIAGHWQDWLQVRTSCPIGQAFRFTDEQLRYHYTQDKDILRREVQRLLAQA